MRINISPLWSKLGIEDEISLVQQLYDVYFGEETNTGEIVYINGYKAEQYVQKNSNVCGFRKKDTIKNFIEHEVISRVDHDGSTFPYLDKTLETDIYKVTIDWDKLNRYAGTLHDYEADEPYGQSRQKQTLKDILKKIDKESQSKKIIVSERILGQYYDHVSTAQPIRGDSSPDHHLKFIETIQNLEKEGFLKIHRIDFDFNALAAPTEEESSRLEEGVFVDEDANFYPAEHCKVTLELYNSQSAEAILIKQVDEQAIRPTLVPVKSMSEVADLGMEEFFQDEIQLINKLLQICNKETKQVILMHPAHLADNASDKAGFDKIEIVKDLHNKYKVFKKFSPPVDTIRTQRVHVIKAEIDHQKLWERAEGLHDEVESWKGNVLGIEQQKKELLKRIKYDLNKFANDETFTISEKILGTYSPQIVSKPLGLSLLKPDNNRTDINFEFMKVLRLLEKEGYFTIEDVEIDFYAQPQPTSEAVEKAKWSFDTREVNEFYPPEHCTVTIRPKVLEIVRDAAKAVIQTVQANRGVLVEQVKRLQESGPAIAEAVKNAQKSVEILRDINKPLISTDSFVALPPKSYEALLLEEQIEINRQILERLEQRQSKNGQSSSDEKVEDKVGAKEMPKINGNRKSDYPLELVLTGKVLRAQGFKLSEPVDLITIQAVGSATLLDPLFKICRSKPTSWKTISKRKIETTVGYDKIPSFQEVLKDLTKFSKYTSGVGLKGALRSLFIGKINDQTGIKIRIAVPIKDWNNLPTKKQEEVVNILLERASSRS